MIFLRDGVDKISVAVLQVKFDMTGDFYAKLIGIVSNWKSASLAHKLDTGQK